jgi:predicted metal-dependent RNase
MSGKTFRSVIRECAKEGDLNLAQRAKLRIILRLRPDVLEREIFNQAQVEGVIPTSAMLDDDLGSVDWAALAEFIKEILPAILQIISLFL